MRLDWTTVQHHAKRLRRLRVALAGQASPAFPSRGEPCSDRSLISQRNPRRHGAGRIMIGSVAALVGDGAAGVVLVGGRSSRMGMAKAELEWHGSTLLRRTLGVLARSVDGPLLVVRSPGQPLPKIPPRVEVV